MPNRCDVCWGLLTPLGYCPNAGVSGHTPLEILHALRATAIFAVKDAALVERRATQVARTGASRVRQYAKCHPLRDALQKAASR